MALILNIDTSSYICSVAISDDDKIIAFIENDSHNHTRILLSTIQQLLKDSEYGIKDLSAIAVNIGPGSYTGLRVGLAAAKGLCYSSGLPLIPVSGLTALANEAIKQNKNRVGVYLILLDNGRNGWYYAAYDENLNTILPPDSGAGIETILSKISAQSIFVCGFRCDDKTNISKYDNIIWLPCIELKASHLAPVACSVMLKGGNNANLLSANLLYINSIF